MNTIKKNITKEEYSEIIKIHNNLWLYNIILEETDTDYLCAECSLTHDPSEDEKKEIVKLFEEKEKHINNFLLKTKYLSEIKELKQKLFDTDYIAIKFAEGWISETDYAPTKLERQNTRNRINELENLIKDL